MVRDLLKLWNKLRKRYDHMKTMVLLQAQYAWQHLRLQDYKFVIDYNLIFFDIVTQLELYGVKLFEVGMFEKTFH